MTVQVEFPKASSESYEILIESGIIKKTGEILKSLACLKSVRTFSIVSDENVAPLYCGTVADSLISAGFNVALFEIPAGEKSKSAEQYFELQNGLAENQITRSDALIALGGGVVGDLTGFTAATYLRGLPFVQIPTTLLAMVDSSVGGKTGIDIPAGKNLVGAFKQPATVLCDPDTLKTLTPEIFSDGMAEVIKHGMIRSEKLLQILLEKPIHENLPEIIEANVKIKRDVVQKDEFDTGERQLLNFGHTIGHAIEKLSNFEVSHGNAVAIGMSMVTRAAVKKCVCPQECQSTLEKLLEKFNLPCKANFTPEEIYTAALSDKKRTADTIIEVIPVALGNCELRKIPISELIEWIE
ncbi:MAG: 3-dehydroquinate synthase [Defluviitaleaceae bacterium]|nr:3-dehydroquinate synthase [Defluviitaleaceae bacterium]